MGVVPPGEWDVAVDAEDEGSTMLPDDGESTFMLMQERLRRGGSVCFGYLNLGSLDTLALVAQTVPRIVLENKTSFRNAPVPAHPKTKTENHACS